MIAAWMAYRVATSALLTLISLALANGLRLQGDAPSPSTARAKRNAGPIGAGVPHDSDRGA